ncbi:enoyl-CoA hydratase [Winogradskya consettensis]|uniref:Enoyl-CoA hydratase n=1 Tax=Winogradskya consettensis TaxID=113560 RepID=A0A919T064_9ACTN|nr:enoyl-CoA hydratase-related protein [Actinoplanes consettensis]GIM82372.1 enoyl-CoA hydratase [Actinoplanes consettensis]
MTGSVRTEIRAGVGWLTIDNPARRNALTMRMLADLSESLNKLTADDEVRVIVLRGEGTTAFAAGADISEFAAQQRSEEVQRTADEALDGVVTSLFRSDTPMIAMIHGFCLGAGLAIALGADIRLADDRSAFAIPAVRLGLGYPLSQGRVLARTVGPAYAAELLLTGAHVDSAEAARIGLVNHVVPTGELLPRTERLAESIAANAPLSLRAAKLAIRTVDWPEMIPDAERAIRACRGSADAVEGQRAYMEKRRPHFSGH